MKAVRRMASLFLFIMIGGCTAATDSTPVSVPLDTPPDYKQIVRAAIQADAASKKPDKKPAAGTEAKQDKKSAAGTEAKQDKKSATGTEAKPGAKSDTKTDKASEAAQRSAGAVRITRIPSKFGWSEISQPRAVNALAGWAWQVCLKGKNKNSVVYMAVLMQHSSIVDARTGTEPDKCESETYEPL